MQAVVLTILPILISVAALVLAVVATWRLSIVGRDASEVRIDFLGPHEKQKLAEAADQAESLRLRLDGFEDRTNEILGRLDELETELVKHAAELEVAKQGIDSSAVGLAESNRNIGAMAETLEGLKEFKNVVEEARSRILSAMVAMQIEIPSEADVTTERETRKPCEIRIEERQSPTQKTSQFENGTLTAKAEG